MYLLAYLEFFQGNEDKCYWSARFLFDRQKVVIADHHDRKRWERYFEPCNPNLYNINFHVFFDYAPGITCLLSSWIV